MKKSDMSEDLTDFLLELLENRHFYNPRDPYDPDPNFAEIATVIQGPVGNMIIDFFIKSGFAPPKRAIQSTRQLCDGTTKIVERFENSWEDE